MRALQVIELFPPPPNELAFFMVRVVDSGRKGRIGVETQVTINSKQVRQEPSAALWWWRRRFVAAMVPVLLLRH